MLCEIFLSVHVFQALYLGKDYLVNSIDILLFRVLTILLICHKKFLYVIELLC